MARVRLVIVLFQHGVAERERRRFDVLDALAANFEALHGGTRRGGLALVAASKPATRGAPHRAARSRGRARRARAQPLCPHNRLLGVRLGLEVELAHELRHQLVLRARPGGGGGELADASPPLVDVPRDVRLEEGGRLHDALRRRSARLLNGDTPRARRADGAVAEERAEDVVVAGFHHESTIRQHDVHFPARLRADFDELLH